MVELRVYFSNICLFTCVFFEYACVCDCTLSCVFGSYGTLCWVRVLYLVYSIRSIILVFVAILHLFVQCVQWLGGMCGFGSGVFRGGEGGTKGGVGGGMNSPLLCWVCEKGTASPVHPPSYSPVS